MIITIADCGTENYIVISSEDENTNDSSVLLDQVYGRILAEDVTNLDSGEVIITKNTMLMKDEINLLVQNGISNVKIFSVLKCEAKMGVCVKCYGASLGHRRLADIAHPVGIEAAQSLSLIHI